MGNPVTVDSDDLELIVMATGIVKSMEKVLEAHKRDPFVCKDEDTLSAAHHRLSKEVVRAKRGELHPSYNDPLDGAAATLLKKISSALDPKKRFATYDVEPGWMRAGGSAPAGFNELRQKGMIEIGSVFEYTLWQSEPKETRIDKAQFRVRITDRGQKMLLELATVGMKAVQ